MIVAVLVELNVTEQLSRRSQDVKNAYSGVVYRTRTMLRIFLGLQMMYKWQIIILLFCFEGRVVELVASSWILNWSLLFNTTAAQIVLL